MKIVGPFNQNGNARSTNETQWMSAICASVIQSQNVNMKQVNWQKQPLFTVKAGNAIHSPPFLNANLRSQHSVIVKANQPYFLLFSLNNPIAINWWNFFYDSSLCFSPKYVWCFCECVPQEEFEIRELSIGFQQLFPENSNRNGFSILIQIT